MWRSPTRRSILRDIRWRQWRATLRVRAREWLCGIVQYIAYGIAWLWRLLGIKAQDAYINSLISQRYDYLRELGERTYQLYLSGKLRHDELLPYLHTIEKIDAQVSAWNEQRQRMLAMNTAITKMQVTDDNTGERHETTHVETGVEMHDMEHARMAASSE